jgi:protein-S-isoprenylcysteine O-methyltransferase Ste14
MNDSMTIFGAGRRIAAITLPILVVAIAARWLLGTTLHFPIAPYSLMLGTGIGLIAVGLALNIVSARFMLKAFGSNRLETRGPYAISRNPMYASFIFLTIPGLSLALDNWAVLAVSVVLYIAVRVSIAAEERWLAAKFGDAWYAYAKRVGRIAPKLW